MYILPPNRSESQVKRKKRGNILTGNSIFIVTIQIYMYILLSAISRGTWRERQWYSETSKRTKRNFEKKKNERGRADRSGESSSGWVGGRNEDLVGKNGRFKQREYIDGAIRVCVAGRDTARVSFSSVVYIYENKFPPPSLIEWIAVDPKSRLHCYRSLLP